MTELQWMKCFGKNLEQIIEEVGIDRFELSQESGVSESSLSRYIRADRMPGIKSIVNLSYVLDCTPGELIDFTLKIE